VKYEITMLIHKTTPVKYTITTLIDKTTLVKYTITTLIEKTTPVKYKIMTLIVVGWTSLSHKKHDVKGIIKYRGV
jgi:hypothetical protein